MTSDIQKEIERQVSREEESYLRQKNFHYRIQLLRTLPMVLFLVIAAFVWKEFFSSSFSWPLTLAFLAASIVFVIIEAQLDSIADRSKERDKRLIAIEVKLDEVLRKQEELDRASDFEQQ